MTEEKKQNTDLLLANVRLSYFFGFKPYEGDDGSSSYCSHLIMATNHPQLGALQNLMRKVATDTWKDKAEEVLMQLKAQDRLCIHRGDVSKPGQDAYKGLLYISSSSKIKPRIVATVGGINQEVGEDHELACYSGCKANAIVSIWAQNNKFGKRINAQLMGVQFVSHDQRLSGAGRVASVDEFGIVDGAGADSAAPAAGGGSGLI
jgi:hypothetical protein